MRHSNVELPSSEEKSKLPDVEAVGSAGLASIVVCGGVVSYVKVRVGPPSVLSASSVARTWSV